MHTSSTWRSSLPREFDHLPFHLYARKSPATGEALPSLEMLAANDIPEIMSSIEAGLGEWRQFDADRRAEILASAATILRERQQDDAHWLAVETGKSSQEAHAELNRAIETFDWFGNQSAILNPRIDIQGGDYCELEAFPLGIALAIVPWNYPAVIGARKIGAMLLAGCAVIVKPSEIACSPLFSFKSALVSAGMPPSALSILLGNGEEIVRALIKSNRIHAVSFTGSSIVGRKVSSLAGFHLLKCITELGGNAPVIILDDCNIEKTARALVEYKFELAGQSCNAPDRIYVPVHLNEQFTKALLACIERSYSAPCTMSPMINSASVDRMEALVDNALACGARVLAGGRRLSCDSNFFPPTLLTNVPPHASAMKEEVFGPILSLFIYQTVDEAIELANDSQYGFASYVFGENSATVKKIGRRLSTGYVMYNGLSGVHPALPVGGVRLSGSGLEGGEIGVLEFIRWRLSRYKTTLR